MVTSIYWIYICIFQLIIVLSPAILRQAFFQQQLQSFGLRCFFVVNNLCIQDDSAILEKEERNCRYILPLLILRLYGAPLRVPLDDPVNLLKASVAVFVVCPSGFSSASKEVLTVRLCDVHTHLQDLRLAKTIHQVMHRSMAAGVTHMVCCGVQESDWHGVTSLAARYPGILPAFGLHPWFISSRSLDWLDRLEQLLQTSSAAVGEIGLDRIVSPRNDRDQVLVFTSQLKLAKKYKRPVNIHCRKAFGLLADLLKENGGLPHGGVIHSYSGSADMVKVFERSGAYISFSGSLTRPHNKKVRQAARAVSLERLLIETDTPDILPTGVSHGLNEPAHVHWVLKALAQLREESIEALANATFANAVRLFKLHDHNPVQEIPGGGIP